jgi:branched-chain amino acid transport system ATP-binding protein
MASQSLSAVEGNQGLLDVRRLEVTYNRLAVAVAGVSFRVDAGQIVAILGANGAGKTTTLRAISGYLLSDSARITAGEVALGNQLLNGRPPHAIAGLGISLIPERDKVFASLTVADNLRAVPTRGGAVRRRRTTDLIFELFPILADRRRQQAGYLSGGERQMLAIAKALLLEPSLLLADELSLGIAPVLVRRLMLTLRQINETEKIAILLVDQNANEAMRIANYVYVLETGRVTLHGSPGELSCDPSFRETYLGLNRDATAKRYGAVGVDERNTLE